MLAWPTATLAAAPAVALAAPAARTTLPGLVPWAGTTSPVFILGDMTGTTPRPESLQGDVVVVHFFAARCAPCVAAHLREAP